MKIPVFLHIPKNAGTYVLSITMKLFRFHSKKIGLNTEYNWNLNLRRLHVIENETHIATFFVHDPKKIRNFKKSFIPHDQDEYVNTITFDNLLNDLEHLNVFSIIIEPSNLIHYFFTDNRYTSLFRTINKFPIYYTVLREPFDRSFSMFRYISGDMSKHEETHKKIKSNSFTEYLKSSQLEDSWIIRRLNGMKDLDPITDTHYLKACSILDVFQIEDINNVNRIIDKVFFDCYQITQNIIPNYDADVNMNKNVSKLKIKKILNNDVISIFNERTKFEQMIYKKYTQR